MMRFRSYAGGWAMHGMGTHPEGEWVRFEDAQALEADALNWRDLQAVEAELSAQMKDEGYAASIVEMLNAQKEESRLLAALEAEAGAFTALWEASLTNEVASLVELSDARGKLREMVEALRAFRARQKGKESAA